MEPYFVRTLRFKGGQPMGGLWFRAWVGSTILLNPDGAYLIDGKFKVKISSASTPLIRPGEGQSELLVPVELGTGEAKVVQEIIW
jgi:hypothetical protein